MATRDPNTVAQKWSNNLAAAATNGTVEAGIRAVTTAPGQAAARQKAVWAANTASSVDRWAANTAAVSLPEWQNAAVTKGVQRIASGASAAEPRMQQFMSKLLPFVTSTAASLPPRGTFTQNLQRANAMATALHNNKGNF